MEGSNNQVKFSSAAYFSTPVWTAEAPMFLKKMLKLTDGYLKKTKKSVMAKTIKERNKQFDAQLDDFGLSNHSESFNADPKAKDFVDFCGQRSYEFLDWCGFDLKNHSLHFTECWVQEFSHKGGGHHDTHQHWNQHVSGFYFLKCSNKTSYPIFHEPKTGARATKLKMKPNIKGIYGGTELIHFKPKPGTLIIFPGYLEHEYTVDFGIEPFRFIHWNIQAIPKEIVKDV